MNFQAKKILQKVENSPVNSEFRGKFSDLCVDSELNNKNIHKLEKLEEEENFLILTRDIRHYKKVGKNLFAKYLKKYGKRKEENSQLKEKDENQSQMDVDDEDDIRVSSFKYNNSNIDASDFEDQTGEEILPRNIDHIYEVNLDENSEELEKEETKNDPKSKDNYINFNYYELNYK